MRRTNLIFGMMGAGMAAALLATAVSCGHVKNTTADGAAQRPSGAGGTDIATATMSPAGPVIVRIVSRHETITASAGASGVVYAIDRAEGKDQPAMSLDQMQAQSPASAGRIRTMRAAGAGMWAGVD